MHPITTKIDAATGKMTITKSGGGTHPFLKGDDSVGEGPKVELSMPYANSAWVMSAICHVVDPIASVPLQFSEDRRGSDDVVDDPDLNSFWELPFVGPSGPMGRAQAITLTGIWLQLAGQVFWIMDDTWLMDSSKKSPLILARPNQMRPVRERGTGDVKGWEYRTGKGGSEVLLPEQVVHLKRPNPYDDINGLAPWVAARLAAEGDFAAGVFAKNLMENNGDQGPIVTADGSPSPEQIEQIERALHEKAIMSRRGKPKALFLAGPNMSVASPDVQSVDANFVGQRLGNRHEVYIAFKVPPSFADVVASYSVGSASDRFRLIEEACMPLAALIADGVEVVSNLFRKSKRTLYATFDFDEHSTMQQVRGERFEIAIKGVENGIPWKTMSNYLGLKMPEFPGWDVGYRKFNMTEVGASKSQTAKPEPKDESTKTSAWDEMKGLFECKGHTSVNDPHHSCKGDADSMQERDPKRIARWEAMVKARIPWVKRFKSKFNRNLMRARTQTLERLQANYEKHVAAAEIKAGVLDLIFDLGEFLEIFLGDMGTVSLNAMQDAGEQMWEDELDRDPEDDPLTMPSTEVLTMVQARQNHLSETSTAIWHDVRGAIGDGIEAGDTISEISARVRESFNGISSERADRIAVTETTAMYEAGRYLTLKEAGISWKEWLSSGLETMRPSHEAADGQTVGINEMFIVGGAKLLYPGMSGAPANQVINCKCMMVAGTKPSDDDA